VRQYSVKLPPERMANTLQLNLKSRMPPGFHQPAPATGVDGTLPPRHRRQTDIDHARGRACRADWQ